MQRQIVFTLEEWRRFRNLVSEGLFSFSQKPYGFRLVSRETGKEITADGRLKDFLGGVVYSVMEGAERNCTKTD
jgi:hypothetical protein